MSVLKGMLQIKNYAQRSESTILTWVKVYGFPAVKLPESSIWESDTDLIDQWRRDQIMRESQVKRPALEAVSRRPGLKKSVKRGKK